MDRQATFRWKDVRRRNPESCGCCGGAKQLSWFPLLQWFLCLDCQVRYKQARHALRVPRRQYLAAQAIHIGQCAHAAGEEAA